MNIYEILTQNSSQKLVFYVKKKKKKERESKQLSSLLNKLVNTEKFAENNSGVKKLHKKKCKFMKNFIN